MVKYLFYLLQYLAMGVLLSWCVATDVGAQDRSGIEATIQASRTQFKAGNYAESLQLAQQAARQVPAHDTSGAKARYMIGISFRFLQEMDSAKYYLCLARDSGTVALGAVHPFTQRIMFQLSNVYGEKKQTDSALLQFDIWANIADSSQLATVLKYKLQIANGAAAYEIAEQAAAQALALTQRYKTIYHQDYIDLLGLLGTIYSDQGFYEAAEALFERSVEIARSLYGEKDYQTYIDLNNLSNLYTRIGRMEEAELLMAQAVHTSEAAGDQHSFNHAVLLNNLAEIKATGKSPQEAIPLFMAAQSTYEKTVGAGHPYYGSTLSGLANLYLRLQQYQAAENLLRTALPLIEKTVGKKHFFYNEALCNLGILYQQTHRWAQAKACYEENAQLYRANLGEHYTGYLQTLNALGDLACSTTQYDSAFYYYQQAILANTKATDSVSVDIDTLTTSELHSTTHLLHTLFALHRYYNIPDRQDQTKAYQVLAVATRIAEQSRNSFIGERDKLNLLTQMQSWMGALMETGIALKEQVGAEALFQYAELNKSVLLGDAIKGNRARMLGDLPDSLVFKELQLQEESDKAKTALATAQTSAEKEQAKKAVSDLNFKIDAFKQSLQDKYPKYHQLKYENATAKATDIQAILPDMAMLLEYLWVDSTVYLFAINRAQIQLYTLDVSRDSLMEHIRQLRTALTDYEHIVQQPDENYQQFIRSAYWMYDRLVRPAVQHHTDIKELIVIADGALGHLPFEVFLVKPAPEHGGTFQTLPYLLNDYTVSYHYAATLWKESQFMPVLDNNGKILAMAANYARPSKNMDNRLPHLVQLRQSLHELPEAKREVESLQQIFQDGTFIHGTAAGETFFKQNAEHYSIIHLAMHGILNKRNPILSSLVFSEDGSTSEDNFLEAHEIAHLRLRADLVVLSACETGYGRFEQGEGILSLARAFMYAGVPALLVSMWEVNDASTAWIMQAFHRQLSQGQNKAAALRQAKLQYLSGAKGRSAHPAYWSAFIQLGDSRPLGAKPKEKPTNGLSWWVMGLGAGLLCIGIGGGIALRQRSKRKETAR